MIKHPASFSDQFLPIFAELLRGTGSVLDPMAGTGKLARIKAYGYTGRVVCNELEPEWANGYAVDEWHFGDAAAMHWATDCSFDAICTSPSYGNRMGDRTLDWEQNSRRLTYDRALGRAPSPGSTLHLQWNKRSGDAYRAAHTRIWRECVRVLQPRGLFLLNVSDHIREGQQQHVTEWHKNALEALGLLLTEDLAIPTQRMGFGANRQARVEAERILVFQRGVK